MIADAGFTIEGTDERALPASRHDLVTIRRRGAGTELPANAWNDLSAIVNGWLGGTEMIRDAGLLDAALHRPQATVFGEEAYPSLHKKAAGLLESIVRNHPLLDGNKRLGLLAVALFYRYNHHELRVPTDDGEEFFLALAQGKYELAEAAAILSGWTTESG